MRQVWMMLALAGCVESEAPLCGQGEWRGFACDTDIGDVQEEAAAFEAEVAEDLEAVSGDPAHGAPEREWLTVHIPLVGDYPEYAAWEDVHIDEVLDLHILYEPVVFEAGQLVDVAGETGCVVTEDSAASSEMRHAQWVSDVAITPDGHPEAYVGDDTQGYGYAHCDSGIVRFGCSQWSRVSLAVDWAPIPE